MKHKHHIIPKHAGGTDEPSNLIELTTEEHAEAHKKLYEQYGRWQDFYAWQGLSGQIGKEELIRQIQSVANSKPKSEETKKKMSEWQIGRKLTKEHTENISKKQKERWSQGKYDVEKLRLSRIGFKQSQHQKDRARETFECAWIVTNPEGLQFNIVNLTKFCKENGLDQGNLSRGKHKGWKAVKITS